MSYKSMPSSPIRLPKTQETQYDTQPTIYETQRYALDTDMTDPFHVNTPPNGFIGQLKQRMSVYYGSSPPSSR